MTSQQAYLSLLEKVNRLDTNQNVHVPKGKFVQVYNEQQRRWFSSTQHSDETSDSADLLSKFLVSPEHGQLPIENKNRDNVVCALPEDFLKAASCYVIADSGSCKDRPIIAWNTKPKNLPLLLKNSNTKPSFDYEETLLSIQDNKVRVYFDDFKIKKVFFSYYRFPADIDLEGYIRVDGKESKTINPEPDDPLVDSILDWCAIEIMRSSQNAEGLNFSTTRLQQK